MIPRVDAPLGPGDRDPILLLARQGFRERPESGEFAKLIESHTIAADEIEQTIDTYGIEPESTYGLALTKPVEYIDADGQLSHLFLFRDTQIGKINLLALVKNKHSKLINFSLFEIPAQICRFEGKAIITNSSDQTANQAEINWLRIIIRRMNEAYKANS